MEEIKTIGDLRNLIKDLPNDFPVGVYYINYWNPKLSEGGVNMIITPDGLGTEINYSHDY